MKGMMKHIITGLVLGAAAVLAACSTPLIGKPETRDVRGSLGVVTVQVGEAARTLQPAAAGFSSYELTFAGPAGASHATVTLTNKTSETVELAAGSWTITATAFTGTGAAAKKAARGSVTLIVTAGDNNAAITLSPYTEADAAAGTFTYALSYPAGLNSGTVVIAKADGTAVDGGTVTLPVTGTTASGTKDLAPGQYKMQIRLEAKDGLIAGITEALHIYPTLTTAAAYTFTAADFVAFAEVDNVTVAGTAPYDDAGVAVTNAEVAITLYNESFKDSILDEEEDAERVTAWFTNLPAGLDAVAKTGIAAGAQTITASVSGTPTAVGEGALAITIPAEVLDRGADLTVTNNNDAKFAIIPQDTGAVYLAGYVQTGTVTSPNNPPANGMFWKYRKNGDYVTHDVWSEDGQQVRYTGLAIDNDEHIHLVGRIRGTSGSNATIIYRQDSVETTLDVVAQTPEPSVAFAPDGAVYMVGKVDSKYQYWKVESGTQSPTMVPLAADFYYLRCFTVDDQYIYFIGDFRDGTESNKRKLTCWKYDRSNDTQVGEKTIWDTSAPQLIPNAVVLKDNYFHLAGTTDNKAFYLKVNKTTNVAETPILETEKSSALGITVSGNDVYLAGYWQPALVGTQIAYGVAVYWKVGNDALEPYVLTGTRGLGADVYDSGTAIAVDGTDLYVAGYITEQKANSLMQYPVYWKIPQGYTTPTNSDGKIASAAQGGYIPPVRLEGAVDVAASQSRAVSIVVR
jgi:hypothetical protein